MKTLTRRLFHSTPLLLALSLCALGQQAQETPPARAMPHDGMVTSVAFSPDGRMLASGSLDGSVIFWDAATAEVVRRLEHVSTYVYTVAFSPDGKSLAAGCYGGAVKIFDAASGREQRSLLTSADVEALAFSRNGRLLASGDDSGAVTLWEMSTGRELRSFQARMPVTSVAINPSSTALAAASGEGVVRVWDVKTGNLLRELKDCARCYYHSVAFSPDGMTLASGGLVIAPSAPLQVIETRGMSSTSSVIPGALWQENQYNVTLWDVRTGQLSRLLKGHKASIYALAFSPKSGLLASGGYDQQIIIWNAQSGARVQTMMGISSNVQAISFSPDGQRLASASGDFYISPGYPEPQRSIVIWDTATGNSLLTLKGRSQPSVQGGGSSRLNRDLMSVNPGGGIGIGEGTMPGPGRAGNTGDGIGTGVKLPSAGTSETDYNRVFSPREVTTKARILAKPAPPYTEKARVNEVNGTVLLRAVLGSDGTVKGVRVVSALPYGLTGNALKAARSIKFIPAVKDQRAVSQYIQIEYNFNLY